MKVVLDTNSLIVTIGRKSKYRPIFDAFLNNKFSLLISNEVVSEYVEILQQRTNVLVAENVSNLLLLSPNTEKIQVNFRWSIISEDADDNKFVDCALNGQADYLVTDDKHFNVLKNIGFPPIKIIKTAEFLKIINELKLD